MIDAPDPELAPVMPPEFAPIVHEKVLAEDAVKVVLKVVPLQMVETGELVTTGTGLTVTVMV